MADVCGAPTAGGSTCSTAFGLCPSCGQCFGHCEHRKADRQAARVEGGRAAARKRSRKGRLGPDELPPLVDHAAAEVWTDTIGRAVVTGRIDGTNANAALRAVREWRESHDAGVVSERLEALVAALGEWKRTGDAGPVLELVKAAR